MKKVDASRLDLAREFRQNPLGPHSADLQKLLRILRWDRALDREIVVQRERHGPWSVGRADAPRGNPIATAGSARTYARPVDAWWEIFKLRWERHTGQPLVLPQGEGVTPADAADVQPTAYPILGYSDLFSVEAGKPIEFKVSSPGPYEARIVRLRCGDRSGAGFKYSEVDSAIAGLREGRVQPIAAGSWIDVSEGSRLDMESFSLSAYIWPTTPALGRWQTLMGSWVDAEQRGYMLGIDPRGELAIRIGDGAGGVFEHSMGVNLLERHWYLVAATFDAASGEVWLGQHGLRRYAERVATCVESRSHSPVRPAPTGAFRLAACVADRARRAAGRSWPGALYNGKIDSPQVHSRPLQAGERSALVGAGARPDSRQFLVAAWDFSRDISTQHIVDAGPHALHGSTVNLPARAMKGWNWDGTEYNWTHAPQQYGAIHFHDDDLYDCGWETDFTYVPAPDTRSGLYCAHVKSADGEDYIPFVVRPPLRQARAPLAVLLPSASYWAYANTHHHIERREGELIRANFTTVDATSVFLYQHPELGCSLYDRHSDGSGVCYSSRLRPVLTIRPNERLWQLPADTHILDWLEGVGIDYDVITEDDLDAHGCDLLKPYRCVMTGTHPEYPSMRMMQAFERFQQEGGRFIYMGGNGFYWRTSYHPTLPGVVEHRRAEDGIRTWFAEGGEYHHSFTGEMGGMWRRMGKAPQALVGSGMAAQGFDRSSWYQRTPASNDARAAFIFDGVGQDERIGDFGIVGGGAAGWEIDRVDPLLGTPPHALVVATASDFSDAYHWVKEEMTHTHAAITGETCPNVRCDMVFYETPNGGAVFSTGSIAWAGALSHADYGNNVSRVTANVVRRFIDPQPL